MTYKKHIVIFFSCISIIINGSCFWKETHPKVIMLRPAGYAVSAGRKLSHGYERSTTYQLADNISSLLQNQYSIKTLLTRDPGERLSAQNTLEFANRTNPDIFVALYIYKEKDDKPHVTIYHHLQDPFIDRCDYLTKPYDFIPRNHAHRINMHQAQKYGAAIKTALSQPSYTALFETHGCYGIPLKPLVGLIPPALLIEIGLHKEDTWKLLAQPLAEALAHLSL